MGGDLGVKRKFGVWRTEFRYGRGVAVAFALRELCMAPVVARSLPLSVAGRVRFASTLKLRWWWRRGRALRAGFGAQSLRQMCRISEEFRVGF